MKKTVRCNLYFPAEVVEVADIIAVERGISRTAAFIRAMGVLQAVHDGARNGYITGLTKDREKLDLVLGAPLI